MIENDVITHDQVEVPIRPGQRVSEVVRHEFELAPVIGTTRTQVLGVLPRNLKLATRDIDTDSLHSKTLAMGVDCNSPDPSARTATGIENA
jgi:hypothetical protein